METASTDTLAAGRRARRARAQSLAATITSRRIDALWLTLMMVLLMPLKQRVRALGGVALPLWLTIAGRRDRFLVRDSSQIWNLEEIWLDGGYLASDDGYELILDLGANSGAAAVYLLSRSPQARLIAVEPDPATARVLRHNLRDRPARAVIAAIGPRAGLGRIAHVHPGFSWGTRVDVDVDKGPGDVVVVTVDALLEGENLAGERVLVKMDIEGAEWAVLENPTWLADVDEVIGEWHETPDKPADHPAYFASLAERHGFVSLPARPEHFHLRRATPRSTPPLRP